MEKYYRYYDNQTVTGYNCRYWEYHPYDGSYCEYSVEVNDPSECDESNPNYLGYGVYQTYTAEDSDGLVLKSSAESFPGVNYPPQEMTGSNHFQMRNDENTRDAMYGIFDGGYLWFFRTERRD